MHVAKNMSDCKKQRALMKGSKPENWFAVREARIEVGGEDLIGSGCDCLIPANPPKDALEARRRQADRAVRGDEDDHHYHTVVNPAKGERPGERGAGPPRPTGYRPVRKTQQRRHEARKPGQKF